jgi:hypothetical protein
VRGLVQRVESEPAARVSGRPVQVARGGARRDQPVQGARQPLPEPVRGLGLPVVELRAVAQREAGQEVVPVQRDRAVQLARVRPGGQRLELGHVHPDPVRVQRHRGAGDQ